MKRPAGTARIVELILAKPATSDRIYLAQALRRDAGKALFSVRYKPPPSGETSAAERMASEIQTAIARGSSALIVDSTDDDAVVDLLYEAQSRGMAMLVLDRPVAARGGKSIPWLSYEPLDRLGHQLIDAVLDAARLTHRPEKGRTVVLRNRQTDTYSAARLASIIKALEAAKLPFEIVTFEGDRTVARDVLLKVLASEPRVEIVLTEEDEGLLAAQLILDDRAKARQADFLLAGYIMYDAQVAVEIVGRCVAVIDRSIDAYSVKAFQTVRTLMDGKTVPARVEVPMNFRRKMTLYVPVATPEQKNSPATKKPTP